MFLTDEQIEFITDRVMPKCQIKILRQNGIKFIISADGKPKVLISAVEEIFGGLNKIKSSKHNKPNFQALEKAMGMI